MPPAPLPSTRPHFPYFFDKCTCVADAREVIGNDGLFSGERRLVDLCVGVLSRLEDEPSRDDAREAFVLVVSTDDALGDGVFRRSFSFFSLFGRSNPAKRCSRCLLLLASECVAETVVGVSPTDTACSAASAKLPDWSKTLPRRCCDGGCTGSVGVSAPTEAGAVTVDVEDEW